MNDGKVKRFTNALEEMLLKMQEASDICLEVTKDISKREFSLIIFIGKNKSLIMREIADFMRIPMSTATGVVDKLVNKGYLQRQFSEEDRRIINVALSKYGKEIYNLMSETLLRFGSVVLSGLDDEEQNQIIGLLEKVALNLEKEAFQK
ncbi:MarR family transcriptional regulator [Fulvivirgaceae bacterium BMA10]|uniref:MarR family transcriptional regulator n=1 Tax=Splendidivirga corallicola TaxID=3051826 RepID=A0ABT8KMA9_9BACT|nr:MarR family transcriptional regulator [Fulvivirgaceae bacterium BMA10]